MARQDNRSAKYLARRESILDGALDVFATVGLEAAGLKEIAAHLELTHPALYHYFGSKEELVHAAVVRAMEDLLEALRSATENLPPHPPVALFELARAHVVHELRIGRTTPFINSVLYGPLSQTAKLPEARREDIVSLQRHVYRLYRGAIVAGQTSEDFVAGPPGPLAFGVLGNISYTVSWFREDGKQSVESVARQIAVQVLRSVSRRVSTDQPPDRY